MTDALNPTVPAGWYPDPWGAPEPRWWDGYAWSENIRPAPEDTPPDIVTPELATPVVATLPVSALPVVTSAAALAYSPEETPVESQPLTSADTPFPSRRALREREAMTGTIPIVEAEEFATATPAAATITAAETRAPIIHDPEYSPEPLSALPRLDWTEAEPIETKLPDTDQIGSGLSEASQTAVEADSPVSAPVSAPVPAETDGWAASLGSWDQPDTTMAPPEALPIFGDAPPVSYSQRTVKYQPLHGRTSAVWFIVFMPLLHVAAVAGSMFLFTGLLNSSGSILALPTEASLAAIRDWVLFALAPLALAFLVFTLVMGFQDRARLRLLGHNQTASPWWLLLHPLIYLIVRSVRVRQSTGRKGSGPLTTYICLYIAPSIAIGISTVVVSALDGAIPS